MATEYQKIKKMFDEYNIPYSSEWLESCIDFCKNYNLAPNYTLKDLQDIVFQQWLFLDLRIVEINSFPINLSNEKKFLLTGNYYLQMVKVVDISKPKYWQIQKIRKNGAKNAESDNDYGKRVLQLTLTDGTHDIEAMEFKPIQCLSINLPPGVKIKLLGPVMVRNGRLMLESQNVKILGGQVEDDKVQYAAENVLARALGLTENPNPLIIDENSLEITEDNVSIKVNKVTTHNVKQQYQNQNKNVLNKNIPKPKIITEAIPPELEVDEELLKELQNDDFEELELSLSKATSSKQKLECKSPDLFKENEIDEELLNEHWNHLEDSFVVEKKPATVQNVPKDVIILNDESFDDIDIDAHLDNIDEEMAQMPSSTQVPNIHSPKLKRVCGQLDPSPSLELKNQPPSKKLTQNKINFETVEKDLPKTPNVNFDDDQPVSKPNISPKINIMTIEKLKKMQPNIGKGKFKIKAKFDEVVQKMVLKDNLYHLVIKVKDATGDLIVRVLSDVVEGFVRISPGKMEKLKELVYQDDETAKEQVMTFLRKIHQVCISLDDVMEIQITRGEDYPVLARIIS